MMRKILIAVFILLSVAGYSQSNITSNAIFNLKDSRSSSIYKFHYLNNADSVYTVDSVGVQFIRSARFKGKTTAQRPAFAVGGMLIYNSDSSALEYYDGGAWQKLSIAAGVSTPTLQQVLTAGSTLSSSATITTAANTFTINTNSATRFHVNASGNVGINGTTTSGYDLHVNGIFGATSGAAGLYFNGTTNLTYAVGSNNATWRMQGDSRYFVHSISSNGYIFYPATDNAREYKVQENGGANIFGIDFANKLVKAHAVPAATSNDTKLVVRGSSDSALRQLDFPIVQTSYTPTRGDVTNIASASVTTSYYSRTGNKIEVWGEVTIDPTATGDTQITLSLPIASSMSNSYDLSGSAAAYDVNQSARIYYSGGVAVVRLNAGDASSHVYSYRYVYYYFAP